MYKYFCDSCGHKFESEIPELDEYGLHNNISCPCCGSWDIYPDTPESADESVKHQIEYENRLVEWDD